MTLLATSRAFRGAAIALELGGELPQLELAYETWGELAPDAGNALLICHGYTSNPHVAGWWPGLLGPGKANIRFDATPVLGAIRAPLLYVLSRTDVLYPPSIAPATMRLLRDAGVRASYVEIDSDYGHFAPTAEWRTWGGTLGDFLSQS